MTTKSATVAPEPKLYTYYGVKYTQPSRGGGRAVSVTGIKGSELGYILIWYAYFQRRTEWVVQICTM